MFEDCFLCSTERSVTEERIIESLIEHIDEIVVIFDENGIIRKMNSICDEILPFTRAEVTGKDIYQLMDSGEVSEPIIIKMLEARKKVYKNIIYPTGKMIAYTAIPLFDSDDNIKGGVLTGRDISRIAKLDRIKRYNENEAPDADEIQEAREYVSISREMKKVKKMILRAARSDSSPGRFSAEAWSNRSMSLRLPERKCRLIRPRANRCSREIGCCSSSCSSSCVVIEAS